MIQSEVINKLARECCLAIGEFDNFKTIRTYIQMALSIGIEHYTKDMEEIVALYKDGVEAGRFKSVGEASIKLGIPQPYISSVLTGLQHTAGGLMFMKTKDYELIERDEERLEPVQPLIINQTTPNREDNSTHLNPNTVTPPLTVGQFNSELYPTPK